ncbi:hypothetical protein Dsin_002758 [Dipteronia sinensis]|uniref:Mitochondrial adenine nucleotide transporter BTL3 n=1 Tax=Dipteronia sinensis TaxID=43782 RepID=A0AAE0B7P7_9ROSI|nr:hypothetical protein Dsin_002758 [Dipteronia sinensis]
MLGFDLWFKNSVSDEQYHTPFFDNSGSNSRLFVNGGLFLEPTVSSSFLHFISSKASSISISCSVSSSSSKPEFLGISKPVKSALFLSVSLRNDGKVCLEQIEDQSPQEATKIEADNVVIETSVKKSKVRVRGRGAMNTTKHLWAGAIAAMVSRTFVAPLERLKLEYILRGEQKNLFELVKQIASNQGLRSFWKGNLVNILRTAPFKAINFYAYDTYRKQLLRFSGNEETTNFERFIAGAAAGMTASILCLPLDTIRTKILAPGGENLGGVIGAFRYMVQTEGFFSLYKGLVPSILSMAPSGAVFYGVYDILKSAYLHSPEGVKRIHKMNQQGQELTAFDQLELGPIRTLLYGAVSGACAEAATYPFEVVRRQLQLQSQATRLSAMATFVRIVEQGGIPCLYAGLIPSLLQVLPSAAISYFVYECMKIVLKVE